MVKYDGRENEGSDEFMEVKKFSSKVVKLEGNEEFMEASLQAVAALQDMIESDLSVK